MKKFEQFKNHEESKNRCPLHDCSHWIISHPTRGSDERKIQEFCPQCALEKIAQDEQRAIEDSLNQQGYKYSYNILERDSTIPTELKNASFSNFIVQTPEEQQLLDFAKNQTNKYLNGLVGNTLITGSTGIGKSHLCFAMAKTLNEEFKAKNNPKSILFISLTEIIKQIKEGWNYGKNANVSEYELTKKLSSVDYLFLDDLGAKNAVVKPKSDWEQDFLFDILNNRETTIINTNLNSQEITVAYNDRNSSRILKGLEGNSFKVFGIKDKRYSINNLKNRNGETT